MKYFLCIPEMKKQVGNQTPCSSFQTPCELSLCNKLENLLEKKPMLKNVLQLLFV